MRIRCPFCAASFRLTRELSDHLGDQHRGERPILLLRGFEPTQLRDHHVGTSLRPADVTLQNCTAAVVRVNAGPRQPLVAAELPKLLSSQTDALIDLELANQFDPVAQAIPASYRIIFSIPEKPFLDAVDRAFHRHLARDSLDFSRCGSVLERPRLHRPGTPICRSFGRLGAWLADERPASPPECHDAICSLPGAVQSVARRPSALPQAAAGSCLRGDPLCAERFLGAHDHRIYPRWMAPCAA